MLAEIKKALPVISSTLLILALAMFSYWTFVSAVGIESQAWQFGLFLFCAVIIRILEMFINYYFSIERKNIFASNRIIKSISAIFIAFVLILVFILLIFALVSSVIVLLQGSNGSENVLGKLVNSFLFFVVIIMLLSQFSVKIFPPGKDEYNGKNKGFEVSILLVLLCLIFIELQTPREQSLYLISSVAYYLPNYAFSLRYLIIPIFIILVVSVFQKIVENNNIIDNIIARKRKIITVIFMLIAISFFMILRKRVNFCDDWDFVLHSVGGVVYYKYPLVYLLSQWNYSLFSNWLCPDTAYGVLCLLAGFIIFFQLFRLWNLLCPDNMMHRIFGRMLTMIPYGTAQFFFGYSGRKTIELMFFTLLVYYAVKMIKTQKGFFLVGLLTGLTFASHNVHILTIAAVIFAYYLSTSDSSLRKKISCFSVYILGFFIVYIAVYGYIGDIQRVITIFFNHNDPSVKEELLWKLSLRGAFEVQNIRLFVDNINSYGVLGIFLVILMWLNQEKKIFTGDKKYAIFLIFLMLIGLYWTPQKRIYPLWSNFDQFVAQYMVLNICAVYLWLSFKKDINKQILPVSMLAVVFGLYSFSMIYFMHNHRNDLIFSFKDKPQAILESNWRLIDQLDFGNPGSELKHKFRIQNAQANWSKFLWQDTPLRTHSFVYLTQLKDQQVMPMVLLYENRQFVADEGRLCSGFMDFMLKTKPKSKHLLIWRTLCSSKEGKKNTPFEILVNAKSLGIFNMQFPLKIRPELKINDFVYREQPVNFPYGNWESWQEFGMEIPASSVDDSTIRVRVMPHNGEMPAYYLWLYTY